MWRDAKGKESRAIESGKATVAMAMARGVRDDVRGGGEGDGDGSTGAWYDEDEGERGARGDDGQCAAAFEVERSAQLLMQEFGVSRWREQVDAAPYRNVFIKSSIKFVRYSVILRIEKTKNHLDVQISWEMPSGSGASHWAPTRVQLRSMLPPLIVAPPPLLVLPFKCCCRRWLCTKCERKQQD